MMYIYTTFLEFRNIYRKSRNRQLTSLETTITNKIKITKIIIDLHLFGSRKIFRVNYHVYAAGETLSQKNAIVIFYITSFNIYNNVDRSLYYLISPRIVLS